MKKKTKTRKMSIGSKILLPSCAIVMVVCLFMGISSYQLINKSMMGHVGVLRVLRVLRFPKFTQISKIICENLC